MAGELTLEEKLEVTSAALKDLHRQLYQVQLHGIANKGSFTSEAAFAHTARLAALKNAINNLEQHYAQLTEEQ